MTIAQVIAAAGYAASSIVVSKTGLATVWVPTVERVTQKTLNKAFASSAYRVLGFGYHCERGVFFLLEARAV